MKVQQSTKAADVGAAEIAAAAAAATVAAAAPAGTAEAPYKSDRGRAKTKSRTLGMASCNESDAALRFCKNSSCIKSGRKGR